MITYNSSIAMIFSVRTGSVVLISASWALIASLMTVAFFVAHDPSMLGITTSSFNAAEDYIMRDLFSQPYSHYIISSMIGFLMLFRVQLSYQRYWFALQHHESQVKTTLTQLPGLFLDPTVLTQEPSHSHSTR